MVAVAPLSPARPEHEDGLRTLEKIIRCYHGFQLVLALYNDPPDYRNRLIEHLDGLLSESSRVDARTCADFAEFEQRLASACASADLVHIVGLDAWLREEKGEKRLQAFNLRRETLAVGCRKPVVFWLPVHLVKAFALQAPDVWEWRRAVLDFSVEGGGLSEPIKEFLERINGISKRADLLESKKSIDESSDESWGHSRFIAESIRVDRLKFSGQTAKVLEAALKLYHRAMAAGENAYPMARLDMALACLTLGDALSQTGAAAQALPLLQEAQQRFEKIKDIPPAKRWAAMALQEQGDSLLKSGQYGQAIFAYEESIRRAEKLNDRQLVAGLKMQVGTVRLYQQRYNEALVAYKEAKKIFSGLGDLRNLGVIWQFVGMVYMEAGHYVLAEHAYSESFAIGKQLGNLDGQGNSLGELGRLYDRMNRQEDAVASYRQAAEKFVENGDFFREGKARSNLAGSLLKLERIAEAHEEILHAIRCKEPFGHAAEPWNSWNILRIIETKDGQPKAAEEARRKAMELFLAYRRDGGENQKYSGRLCAATADALRSNNRAGARRFLRKNQHNPAWVREGHPEPLLETLSAIIAGNRDPALADNPALTYDQAAEIILLLEALRVACQPA